MANRLVRYEYGAGIGVVEGLDSGRLVVGDSLPVHTSTAMYGVACDNSGNIYVTDSALSAIYRIDESGTVFLFAGLLNAEGSTDGDSTVAKFNNPRGLAVDRSGYLYVADRGNGSIRRIDKTGNVGTLCTGITSPFGVAVGPNGYVYVTDDVQHVVYQVLPNGSKSVLAGSAGVSGNVAGLSGGARVYGSTARFNTPTGIAVDASGNIYIADTGNNKIKKIYPDGWVVVHSGSGTQGDVLGVAASARFTYVELMTVDRKGDLLVVDSVTTGASSSSSTDVSSSSSGVGATGTDRGNLDKIKRIDTNGTVSLVSVVDNGLALGIGVTPNDIIYVVRSAGTVAENSSSSTSSTAVSVTSSSSTMSTSSSSKSSMSLSSSSTESSSTPSSMSVSSSSSVLG
jgi:hypothetical protein